MPGTFLIAIILAAISVACAVARIPAKRSYKAAAAERADSRRTYSEELVPVPGVLAVLELKTTIRSDRARGAIRNLTSTLTQHSGANVPLAAVVTAEPLPGRLASVVPRTGDTHAVFHVARGALALAVDRVQGGSQYAEWKSAERYVRDFGELFPFLRGGAA